MFLSKFKKVLNYLGNNIVNTVVIALQIGLVFILAYYSINDYMNFYELKSNIDMELNGRKLYYINSNEDYNIKLSEKEDISDYYNFYKYLSGNYEVLNFSYDNVFLSSNSLSEELKNNCLTTATIDNSDFSLFKGYWVNDRFMKEFNISVCEGRSFKEEDYKVSDVNNVTPAVLGYSFKKQFNVGDIINYKDYNYNGAIRKLQIIGFLHENQLLVEKPIMIATLENLNYDILMPNKFMNLDYSNITDKNQIEKANRNIYKNITQSYLILNSDNDIEDIKSRSVDMNFLDISIVSSDDNINSLKDYFSSEQQKSSVLLLIIFISICMEVFITILSSVNKQKREFLIYYALGADGNYIRELLVLEQCIYFISGILVSSIFFAIFNKMNLLGNINLRALLLTFILFIVIIIFNSIYFKKYLKRYIVFNE